MAQDIIVSIPSARLFFPLISVVLLAAAVIMGLDCVWRVEKRLRTFMRLLTAAIVFLALRQALGLLAPAGSAPVIIMDIVSSLLLLFSLIEMYRIIRTWDNEP